MSRTLRSIPINSARVVGMAILGAVATIACTTLILIFPVGCVLLLALGFSDTALAHVAVGALLTLLASLLFRVELGALILAWIAATAVGALIGGFVGTLLGYVSASSYVEYCRPTR